MKKASYSILMLVFMLGSCNIDQKKEKVKSDKDNVDVSWNWNELSWLKDSIKTGDLILRHSDGFSSDMFQGASKKEKKYSHSGIAVKNSDGSIDVYHMLGGVDNPNFNLKRDSIQAFCEPKFCKSFAVYGYQLTDNQRNIIDSLARSYYVSNLEFDMDFNLESDDRMYCSEFIYKTLVFATKNKNYIPLSEENGKAFVGIDDLYLNPNSKKITEHEHQKKY